MIPNTNPSPPPNRKPSIARIKLISRCSHSLPEAINSMVLVRISEGDEKRREGIKLILVSTSQTINTVTGKKNALNRMIPLVDDRFFLWIGFSLFFVNVIVVIIMSLSFLGY
ncbi:hypothetical protein D3C78_1005500 [compost metagenome]